MNTTVVGTYGKIDEFNSKQEEWSYYTDRLEYYFHANEINDDKKKSVLLSVCGAETFRLIKNLTAPNGPAQKTYDQIKTLVENHYTPTRNVIMEKFIFNSRAQKPSETIMEYVAELRKLSKYCQYGGTLDTMLRDRIVCGINSVPP